MNEENKPPPLAPNPLGPTVRQEQPGPPPPLPYTMGIMGAAIGEKPKPAEVLNPPSWSTPWSGMGSAFGGAGSAVMAFWLSYGLAMAYGTLEAAYSPAKTLAPVFARMGQVAGWIPGAWEALVLGPVYGFAVNLACASLMVLVFGVLECGLFILFMLANWRTRLMLGMVTVIVVMLNLLVLAFSIR
jgi:hypothetical protein